MLNCKNITELASKSLDMRLPFTTRTRMKLHLLICKSCARYVKHLQFIQNALQHLDQHQRHITLPVAAKQRIAANLKKHSSATETSK